MKLSSFLSSLFWSASLSYSAAKQWEDMSNGARLAVDIESPPAPFTTIQLDTAQNQTSADLLIQGTATVDSGTPDVAYIYIIDSSGSTSDADGACGSTLDCVQSFFQELHKEVVNHGSAELVGIIDFDSDVTVTADLQDPSNSAITDAIGMSYSDGGTGCRNALERAALMVMDPSNTASTTVVIFAGDGKCYSGDDDYTAVQGENITESALMLGNTGAIVHSIAVGDSVDCTEYNSLNEIQQNGGDCFSIQDPNNLPEIVDDIIKRTNMTNVEMKVNGGVYAPTRTSKPLPEEAPATVTFEAPITGLMLGKHEVCVRVSGQDTLENTKQVEECRTVMIQEKPQETLPPVAAVAEKAAPMDGDNMSASMPGWEVLVVVVIAVVGLGVVAIALKLTKKKTSEVDIDLQLNQQQDGSYVQPNVV